MPGKFFSQMPFDEAMAFLSDKKKLPLALKK